MSQLLANDNNPITKRGAIHQPFRPITLTCTNVGYTIRRKVILQGINLIAEPGSLVALVGPCGAGKTTFLNCLSFRSQGGTRTGQVFLNGHEAKASDVKDVCNYVMADGRMLPYLTVYETLMIAAKLKLPLLSQFEREVRVENVIVELGLHKCRDTYIGGEWKKGVSTGERKRVWIAIELLGEPSILIMDEPTSGLDSKLACELLSVLQKLASTGRTIIMSIHQPTSQMWSMLDYLHLMAHGQTVYSGPAMTAKAYFNTAGFSCPKNYNPADFMLALVSEDSTGSRSVVLSPATSTNKGGIIETSRSSACSNHDSTSTHIPELEAAISSVRSQRPDIIKLISAFWDSEENQNLKKRIKIANSSADSVESFPVKHVACSAELSTRMASWFVEVGALYKLGMRYDSFLSDDKKMVIFDYSAYLSDDKCLSNAGGIFWQLSGDIALQKPYVFDTHALIMNPWTQLFIDGIDGQQPLLEALENGVDNDRSQPLLEVFKSGNFYNAYNITKCGIEKMNLLSRGYPNFGIDYDKDKDSITPYGLEGMLIGVAQLVDYNYNKVNWRPRKTKRSSEYWISLSDSIGRNFYDAFSVCVGGITLSRPKVSGNDGGGASLRNLITIGDTGIENALLDLLGVGAHDMAAATKEIHRRLQNCDNGACKWINKKTKDGKKFGVEAYVAGMALTNVLGALFFAVANLGFSSYDALLTFPQERALFNRESASGLYRPSSYFIAKNLADLPFQLIPSFVLVTIFYLMVGLGGTFSQYMMYIIICAGMTFAAYGFGYFVSAASPRMEIAVLAAPVTLVIWLTTAGFFLRDEQIPKWVNWFSYLGFYKWGFFSLVTNQFPAGGNFGVIPNELAVVIAGISDSRLWLTSLLIYILGFSYRIIAFLTLKYTNRSVGVDSQ